ncbi:MAG TPA: phenylalanine--tRNA ligase subunit beta, partial [Bacteroidales bacterium]|nr:phenylalanine--tRNA ligase subunit beta [Bacteroidales bacterium]
RDPAACPRYSGLTMTGLKVAPSPRWLCDRLEAVGLRPINNLVDISNYVMMETGQPLHFFDAEKISGRSVIVGQLPEGTPFTTLDGVARTLSAEDLMICDAGGGMCIAGVFGGTRSGVTESTTAIFIESAAFNAVSVRKTSRRHGLKTDASFRFERGSDPCITVYALQRAVQLIREIAGGKVSSPVYDVYPVPVVPVRMDLRTSRVDALIGKKIPREHLEYILESLDIRVVGGQADTLSIEVPPYRVDVTREADVIEEVLRIYGYNNVEDPEHLRSAIAPGRHPDSDKLRNQVSDMLAGQGFHEAMCNSLSTSGYYNIQDEWKAVHCVPILNPVSQDLDVMRQTLLFGGLETVRHNRNRRVNDIRLFEFGNVYRTDGSMPRPEATLTPYSEEASLLILLSGSIGPEAWNRPAAPADVFELKSALENIGQKLGLKAFAYVPSQRSI